MNDTPTQVKIKQHNLQPIVVKLESIGLAVIDKSDLDFTQEQIKKFATLDGENRMLRAQLARARKQT